ncbi:MAG: biotin carboxylase [Burkholderiales bacterium RIFCSPLOWO2_02_FULL_57_36]|nr:MAG: biotin carboxylase [Burkholderiales bacterium RIFCSPLOWO2_02_FULL_57_36]
MTKISNELVSSAPVVLVDAYSTGAMLARAFGRQRPCLHVRSRQSMPDAFSASLPTDLFIADLTLRDDDIDALLAALAPYRPGAVVAASEFGVELADLLAARLGLPGNASNLSRARRDKYLMANVAAQAGIAVAGQTQGSELATLLQWYRLQPIRRVVVKPIDSAGSDNVFICNDESQITDAVRKILGTTNLMMRDNRAVLLQHYLEGDEYVVNTVSHASRHWVTDIWKSSKILAGEGRKIYDYEDLLAPDAEEVAALVTYVGAVLDAVGVVFGPAHTELILTSEGPRLLETGARVSGLANPAALTLSTGADQIELTTACHTDATRLARHPLLYKRSKHARCVNLIARREGHLSHSALQQCFDQLASFESVRFRSADRAQVRPTVDLNTSPGALFLVHDDPEYIDRDYQTIRQWEGRHL